MILKTFATLIAAAAMCAAGTLQSAGSLAFGPNGVLFVGDSTGAKIWAYETADTAKSAAQPVEVKAINDKLAALLGVMPSDVLINDVAVNPLSKRIYLSVHRGKGNDATPLIIRADASGKLEVLDVNKMKSTAAAIPNPTKSDSARARMDTITDLAYLDGKVLVAGLTNEEFSSNMRTIDYPFAKVGSGASVEIWHTQHGQFETNSPVRTFTPYMIDGQPSILAAYTCTPLVKIPMSELKAGAKVMGTTVTELGMGNRPLDMIMYTKNGKDYLLMANSSRGMMKMDMTNVGKLEKLTNRVDYAGLKPDKVLQLNDVIQMDKYDDTMAVVLRGKGTLDLKSVALP
jgi:hypothetical protein